MILEKKHLKQLGKDGPGYLTSILERTIANLGGGGGGGGGRANAVSVKRNFVHLVQETPNHYSHVY